VTGLGDSVRALPVVDPGDSLTRFAPFVEISVPLRDALADALDATEVVLAVGSQRTFQSRAASLRAALAAVARQLEDGAA